MPVLQSISLNGRLAALVCLAYSQNMGFGKIAFWCDDVDEHEVTDRDGQAVHAPKGTFT
jgi:hypothetical protein